MVDEITTGFLFRVVDNFSKPLKDAEKLIKKVSSSSASLTKTIKKEAFAQKSLTGVMTKSQKALIDSLGGSARLQAMEQLGIKTAKAKIGVMERLARFAPMVAKATLAIGIAAATANERFASMRLTLEASTGSAKDAAAIFERLRKFGEVTPVPLSQIVNADAALIEYTGSQKKAEAATKRLSMVAGDYTLNLGTLTQSYVRLNEQHRFGRLELRYLGRAAAPMLAAMREIAKQNNVSAATFNRFMMSGRLSSEWYIKALEKITDKGGAAYNMMQKRNETFMANLKEFSTISAGYLDSLWKMVFGNSTLGQSFHKLNTFLRDSEGRFDKITKALSPVFSALGTLAKYTGGIMALPGLAVKAEEGIGRTVHTPVETKGTQTVKHIFTINIDDPKGYVKGTTTKSEDRRTEFNLGANMGHVFG